MKIVLDYKQYKQIVYEDHPDYGYVEKGDWVQEYKFQYREVILLNNKTGKFYLATFTRSGSPFSDWHWGYEDHDELELFEVEKVTKTVTVESWEIINDLVKENTKCVTA